VGGFAGLVRAFSYATVDNPVLVKEFRTRMRGTRAYWVLLGYTLLLAGVVAMMYFGHEVSSAAQDLSAGGVNPQGARDLGRWIYGFCFVAQSLMVAFITPAITAGTVTIEREQRSYELLATTPLRPVDIIRGKLAAAVAFVMLLLTASLPLVSLSFLVGGVSPSEIFFSYVIIGLSAFVYGATGIFWSATLKTTAGATVVTYLTVMALFIVTSVPGAFAAGPGATGGVLPEAPFQSLNPLTATFQAVKPEQFFQLQIPSWIGSVVLNLLTALLISVSAMARLEHFDPPRPWWPRLLSTLLWCAFSLFLMAPLLGGAVPKATNAAGARELVATWLGSILMMVVLVTPILNTGDLIVRRGESAAGRYLRGLLPFRSLGNDLSCGLPLVAGWTLFSLALLPLAFQLMGKSRLLYDSGVFLPGVLVCLAVMFGLAGVGNLLSVSLPSRWAACVLTYLVAVVLLLLPFFPMNVYNPGAPSARTPNLLFQVLYLLPWKGFEQLGNPGNFTANNPALLLGKAVPVWLVNVVLYTALGLFGYILTLLRVSREGHQLQVRMEATERTLSGASA
jgi:ABC-type transport system involved in multi-copper enzyme maturation permease subunit